MYYYSFIVLTGATTTVAVRKTSVKYSTDGGPSESEKYQAFHTQLFHKFESTHLVLKVHVALLCIAAH